MSLHSTPSCVSVISDWHTKHIYLGFFIYTTMITKRAYWPYLIVIIAPILYTVLPQKSVDVNWVSSKYAIHFFKHYEPSSVFFVHVQFHFIKKIFVTEGKTLDKLVLLI
jgi:hypothetical protein